MRAVARRFGWGDGAQWSAIVKLLGGESSWNPTIKNPTSSAYGLFQFLDSTWATVGGRKTSNPGEQAEYGFRYIRQRYGDPMGAYRTWLSRSPHWYDNGGILKPGRTSVINATGKPEAVLTAPQWATAGAAIRQV
ncbi:transglycosylase SLT domain-containing protein [Pseudonocardia alni]|uniref:aggregation-promoting factor C-terminal-like domain-containing protein n=1 Tax=Pseudonocardia alni TaxID=33907 RepID=UPI0033C57A08